MALTQLQHELLNALLDSGVNKVALIQAVTTSDYPSSSMINSHIGMIHDPQLLRNANQWSTSDSSCFNDCGLLTDTSTADVLKVLKENGPIAAVERLLSTDPYKVAKIIKSFMQQHNISQREVVESTSLNQSHLSQHLNRGTAMKTRKRSALYLWYVKKNLQLQKLDDNEEEDDDPSLNLTIEDLPNTPPSPKRHRRSRFKWGSASKRILYDAYANNRNPTKDERDLLVEACNRAECAHRGLAPSQEGILGSSLVTEVRVYNWFANRRKEDTFKVKYVHDSSLNSTLNSTRLDSTASSSATFDTSANNTQQVEVIAAATGNISCTPAMSQIPTGAISVSNVNLPVRDIATTSVQVMQSSPLQKRNDIDPQPNGSNIQQAMIPNISQYDLNMTKDGLSINQVERNETIISTSNHPSSNGNAQLGLSLSGVKAQGEQGCLSTDNQPLFDTGSNTDMGTVPVIGQSQVPHLNNL